MGVHRLLATAAGPLQIPPSSNVRDYIGCDIWGYASPSKERVYKGGPYYVSSVYKNSSKQCSAHLFLRQSIFIIECRFLFKIFLKNFRFPLFIPFSIDSAWISPLTCGTSYSASILSGYGFLYLCVSYG